MTRDHLIAELAQLAQHLDNRVELWRVIVDENGVPTGQRIYRGAFQAPPDWRPPTLETLMREAKKG